MTSLLDGPVDVDAIQVGDHDRTLARHLEVFGPRPAARGPAGAALHVQVAEQELTGRGGGHLPVTIKWSAALRSGGGGIVVANAAESEPVSAKDRTLLRLRPHLVLDGLLSTADVVGAERVVVWLHGDDHATRRVLARAISERELPDRGVEIVAAPSTYLSGESSAIVRALSGGPALPYLARQPAAVSGVNGRPTLVHNVETLARVALIARGLPADGSLVTVVASGRRVVVPVCGSERFGELIARLGVTTQPQAALVGGYGGSWLPWNAVADLPVSEAALRRAGHSLGAGVIVALPAGVCGLAETARLARYLERSSAQQCGPCRFGLADITDVLDRVAWRRARRGDVDRLLAFAGEVEGRGACHLPDGVVRLVRTAVRTFSADLRHHRRHGACQAATTPFLPAPLVMAKAV